MKRKNPSNIAESDTNAASSFANVDDENGGSIDENANIVLREIEKQLRANEEELKTSIIQLKKKNKTVVSDLEKKLHANEEDIQASMAKLDQDKADLMTRKQNIINRQNNLLQQHGGTQVSDSDIIKLNVSGTEMFARRDTLTIVEGSRLAALFSGRWESRLLRDASGIVFMEAKPDAFKKILEYLYIIKLSSCSKGRSRDDGSSTADPLYPSIESKPIKECFDVYMDFYRLKQEHEGTRNDDSVPVGDTATKNNDLKYIISHEAPTLLARMKKELDNMETRLVEEESFVEQFLTQGSIAPSLDLMDDTIREEDLGILNLLVCGEIIVAKRSTLCLDPKSKLAQDFSSDKWLQDHAVIKEDGKRCFLVEQPLSAFRELLDHLHLKSIASDKVTVQPIDLDDSKKDESDIFKKMYDYYFPDGSNMLKVTDSTPSMDSTVVDMTETLPMDTLIATDKNDQMKLKEWVVQSVNCTAFTPKLLYRASRDGWDADDFHRTCDNKGATITVIKSTEGYIFGGFTDKSWTSLNGYGYVSSNKAFMFHLKCHEGLPAEKYNIRKENRDYAMRCHSSLGPCFGHYDLCILFNANSKNCGFYSIPEYLSYDWNNRDPSSFLTGSKTFKVADYEVFQV